MPTITPIEDEPEVNFNAGPSATSAPPVAAPEAVDEALEQQKEAERKKKEEEEQAGNVLGSFIFI